MQSARVLSGALALASLVVGQAQSTRSCDSTGLCWSTYTVPATGVRYGVALPAAVVDPYDALISITAPVSARWAGFCWGGTMVWNPLTVAWPNGNTAVPSSRFAFGLSLPQPYDEAEHTLMRGTISNSTHWTVVARCRGCTGYQGNDGERTSINGSGIVTFAWARGTQDVSEPANNGTSFGAHQDFGKWQHNLKDAQNTNFDEWVAANSLAPVATSSSTAPTSTSSAPAPPSTTVVTSSTPSSTVRATIPASCSGAGNPAFQNALATGWKATKVLGGLQSPRQIVFDNLGNMLVVQSGKGISVHAMGADGCVTSTKTLISLNSLNHGLQLSADGNTLYASSMTQVYSWPYTASTQTLGTRATIVTGMFNGGAHVTRTLQLVPGKPNLILVSHGSNANLDMDSARASTGRAIIKAFDMSAIPSGGYNYVSQGYVVAYGLRNEVGMTMDNNNKLWGVENSADDIKRTVNGQSKDIHANNPGERLNYVGDVTVTNNANNWHGYPTCFNVWEPSDFTDVQMKVGDPFVLAPNATYKDSNCLTSSIQPSTVFQAHSAPIDCKFDSSNQNLYVTFHGSWNRQPTTGFKLVVVPFSKQADGSYKPTGPLNSQTSYSDVMRNPDVTKCAGNGPSASSGCFRPAGIAFDKAGRLYMTSDTSSNGEVWVLGKS